MGALKAAPTLAVAPSGSSEIPLTRWVPSDATPDAMFRIAWALALGLAAAENPFEKAGVWLQHNGKKVGENRCADNN